MSRSRVGPLRRRAEDLLLQAGPAACPDLANTEDLDRLVHELQVHQIELQMQNEELRLSQVELERSRDRYFELYDLAPVGYLTLSLSGLIREANLTVAELLGVPRQHLRNKSFALYVAPEHQQRFYLQGMQARKRTAPQVCELRLLTSSKRPLHLQMKILASVEKPNDILVLRATLTDISVRVEIERQIRELNASLERRIAARTAALELRARQLQELTLQLTSVELSERRRVAELLHDGIQQLLVGARMQIQVLRAGDLRPESSDCIAKAIESIDQAIQTARTLAADLCPPLLRERGLAAALEWLARRDQETFELHVELRAEARCEPKDERIRVLLFQAARELLFNVHKHAGVDRAQLTLDRTKDGRVRLVVEDKGRGCPSPLDPVAPTASQGGIGLFSIQERLGHLGGRLEMESAPGNGCRVTVIAPVETEEAPGIVMEELAVGSPEPPRLSRRDEVERIRVLLADDHKIVRDGLARLLHSEGEFELVAEASDGLMAVELARQLQPDVVVMDVSMPRMNGIEATRIITKELPAVRVVGLSMHESSDMAAAMYEAGARSYVSKIGPYEELLAAIRAAYGAARA